MKQPPAERHNLRILQITTGLLLLPLIGIKAVCSRIPAIGRWKKTQKQRDAADDLHQSRVRRELRGLPPDHV